MAPVSQELEPPANPERFTREVLRYPLYSLNHVALRYVRTAAAPLLDQGAGSGRVEAEAVGQAHGYFLANFRRASAICLVSFLTSCGYS